MNYNRAFAPNQSLKVNGYDPTSSFSNNNFANNRSLLHDNLQDNVLKEEIREYSVIIDSKDRNYQMYPDPYNYEVTFKPSRDTPNPVINDELKNVKYIRLQECLLPLYNKVKIQRDYDEYDDYTERTIVDVTKPVTNELYTVLSLGCYTDENYLSTNDVLSDSFATIYYDSKANETHYFGCTANGSKVFADNNLEKITKLKISFRDPYGKMMKCPHVDKTILSNMQCNCEDPTGDDNTDCFRHNLFHPLNPIFQHHLHFKIGVVEPRLNKKIFS